MMNTKIDVRRFFNLENLAGSVLSFALLVMLSACSGQVQTDVATQTTSMNDTTANPPTTTPTNDTTSNPPTTIPMNGTTSNPASTNPTPDPSSQSQSSVNTTGVLQWDAPQTDTNGNPLGNITYNLYYGTVPGFYTTAVPIPNTSKKFTDLALAPGTYYFAVTAVDSAGNESDFSNEVSAVIP